jgi:2-polyprenyl-3-methyl-5-hydroxy-6-metoxy-1,4-benzoquinol methylase
MALIPDLSTRVLRPELMDDPSLDAGEHVRALAGLRLMNRVARTAAALWRPIRAMAAAPGHGPVRVLDVATGSGDIPAALVRRARAAGLAISIDACDISERTVAIAADRAKRAGVDAGAVRVRFFRADAIRDELPDGYDIVTCSLFMHHLEEPQVVELLYKMRAAAGRMVLVSDLRRCGLGYAMALAASRALSRSRVAHFDAPQSVRAAFSVEEFGALADEAGMDGALIQEHWPCRFLLAWRRA